MKGIYLTEEGKKEIEAKIAELEITGLVREHHLAYYEIYKEILSSATILPVEDNWSGILFMFGINRNLYPNGVIIKPKE